MLQKLPEKAARQTALCTAIAMMAGSFLYIAGIRYGLFEFLETQLGLDTKGRALLFANVAPYYEISFTYMGRGTGFERMVEWFSGAVQAEPLRTQTQIHNDFLRMYLNIGFIGYWVWLWSWLPARLGYWFRQGGKGRGLSFPGRLRLLLRPLRHGQHNLLPLHHDCLRHCSHGLPVRRPGEDGT